MQRHATETEVLCILGVHLQIYDNNAAKLRAVFRDGDVTLRLSKKICHYLHVET